MSFPVDASTRPTCVRTGEQSELLILDEPTTGLDKDSRDHFYELVRKPMRLAI